MKQSPRPYRKRIRIRFAHTDPAGIVFFPRYFEMIQTATEDWFNEALDIDYANYVLNDGNGLPTVHTECQFMRPCRLGEVLEMEVRVTRLGGASLELAFFGLVDEELRMRGRSVLVQTDLQASKPVRFTGRLRSLLEGYRELSGATPAPGGDAPSRPADRRS
ncbi:MAG: thioesterase family protein [Aquisalimonadaceae bacterium]